MAQSIHGLSISGRLILDLHSLNNEGGEGNQIQTRMVNVIGPDGRLVNVNAISGDMLKHIQAEHLYRIGRAGDAGLPLCAGCREFNANRILADAEFVGGFNRATPDRDVMATVLRRCVLDDVEGILVTANSKSIGRKSVVEFGWVVGVPGAVTTDSYLHAKYVSDSGNLPAARGGEGANLGQNLFHRPTSSGIYATVASVEASRIGFNDITQRYEIDAAARAARWQALIESLLYTFVEPNGAMRNTQTPHVAGFEGVVALSHQPVPAPTVSPLAAGYVAEVQAIATHLNTVRPEAVEARPFGSMAEYAGIMAELRRDSVPFGEGE